MKQVRAKLAAVLRATAMVLNLVAFKLSPPEVNDQMRDAFTKLFTELGDKLLAEATPEQVKVVVTEVQEEKAAHTEQP